MTDRPVTEPPAPRRVPPFEPPVVPTRAAEDTDAGWGDWRDPADSDDERLLRERPPHWSH